MSTTSKVYVFAGASSAIAQATATLLQANGHKVIGISTKNEPFAYDSHYCVDGYSFGSFPQIEEDISGLVYFPGTINLKPFARFTPEEFRHDMEVNALGAAAFVQAYVASLKKSKDGSIVFLSSVAASTGLPFHASIAMAKGALEGLTKSLAAELAPTIRVNAIAPSLVNTPLGSKFLSSPERMEQMQKRNPMGKVGEAGEVAQSVAFLLENNSSWITGQVLSVDGGMGALKI